MGRKNPPAVIVGRDALRPMAVSELPTLAPAPPPIPNKFLNVEQFEAVALAYAREAQRTVVAFGRVLTVGYASFEHGEFGTALNRIAASIGSTAQTLRRWMRVARGIDDGALPGPADAWEAAHAKADVALRAFENVPKERLLAEGVSPSMSVREIQALGQRLKDELYVDATAGEGKGRDAALIRAAIQAAEKANSALKAIPQDANLNPSQRQILEALRNNIDAALG
jgi:hypothetical protein